MRTRVEEMTEAYREQRKQERRDERLKLQHLLSSEEGQVLMKMLRDNYYDIDLVGGTVEETYRRLGARDVVKHLQTLLDSEEK